MVERVFEANQKPSGLQLVGFVTQRVLCSNAPARLPVVDSPDFLSSRLSFWRLLTNFLLLICERWEARTVDEIQNKCPMRSFQCM